MLRVLAVFIGLIPTLAGAVGVPRSCQLKSPETKLARECFIGDMASDDDQAMFIGTDETSPLDLNYCFNAFIMVYPPSGDTVQVLVLKDGASGNFVPTNYAVSRNALAPGRIPASRSGVAVKLSGLKAECFARKPETDKCSKGFFGVGATDIPFAIELKPNDAGYTIRGSIKDRAVIEGPNVPTAHPGGVADSTQTSKWLTELAHRRLVSQAQRHLASLSSGAVTRDELNAKIPQFRYCRMALDALVRQRKLESPFAEAERAILDQLDGRLNMDTAAEPAGVDASNTAVSL